MKKEEILEASKKENKKRDIFAYETEARGATYAAVCMVILACIYFIYEIMSGKGQNPALYSMISVYNAVVFGYKAMKVEEHRTLNAFTSILWGLMTIILVLSYFKVI